MGIVLRGIGLNPGRHRRTGSEGLPTSAEATHAVRTGRIDNVMSDFRVRLVSAAVELAIENDPAANARSHRYIDQTFLVFSGAPASFGQGCGVGIVFHGHRDTENLRQILNRILSLPAGEKVDYADLPCEGINRTRGPNANTHDLDLRSLCHLMQHLLCAVQGIFVATLRVGRAFGPREHTSFIVDHPDSNLGTTDIDSSDQNPSRKLDSFPRCIQGAVSPLYQPLALPNYQRHFAT